MSSVQTAKDVAGRVTAMVRANKLLVDNLGQLPPHTGITIPGGLVLLLEVWQAPPGEGIRIPKPHDYRLIGVLAPGASPTDFDQFGMTIYQIAFNLGARPEHLVEITNTYMTQYKDLIRPEFLSPSGTLLTVSWPYAPWAPEGLILPGLIK